MSRSYHCGHGRCLVCGDDGAARRAREEDASRVDKREDPDPERAVRYGEWDFDDEGCGGDCDMCHSPSEFIEWMRSQKIYPAPTLSVPLVEILRIA